MEIRRKRESDGGGEGKEEGDAEQGSTAEEKTLRSRACISWTSLWLSTVTKCITFLLMCVIKYWHVYDKVNIWCICRHTGQDRAVGQSNISQGMKKQGLKRYTFTSPPCFSSTAAQSSPGNDWQYQKVVVSLRSPSDDTSASTKCSPNCSSRGFSYDSLWHLHTCPAGEQPLPATDGGSGNRKTRRILLHPSLHLSF